MKNQLQLFKKPPLKDRLALAGDVLISAFQERWWDFCNEHFSKHCKVCGIKLEGFFGSVTTCNKKECIQKYQLREHIDSILNPNTSDKNRYI